MESVAQTLYEHELEQQVWKRDKIIQNQFKIMEQMKKLLDKIPEKPKINMKGRR